MVKWKLKLNFLQRMHPLCVCWLWWRMSTQFLWRLQVRWTEFFFSFFFLPPSPSPLLPFYLNLPVLRNTGGIRVKSAMQKNFSPEKSQNYILTCHTFDEELRETAACGFCFPLSSSRVARWKHLGGSSENRLQLLEHFELSCVLWAPPY